MNLDNPQFLQYASLVMQWNAVYNLTAAQSVEEFIKVHILDSLLSGPFLQGDAILDVGSGAGLPGIPLAIAYPSKQFVLLESRGKRARFLQLVVNMLKLKNVRVVHARVEAYQVGAVFSTIITRAFSSLSEMLRSTRHLCHPSGLFLAMKGRLYPDEIANIDPDFTVEIIHRYHIPGVEKERHIIGVMHKERVGWQK